MKTIKQISQMIEKSVRCVGLLCMISIVCLVFLNVVSRYAFGISIGAAEEWTIWAMLWGVYLFIGIQLKKRAHISVDILTNKLKGKKKSVYLIVSSTISLVMGISFFLFTWQAVSIAKLLNLHSITTVPVPIWIVKLCLPIGFLLFIFFAFEQFLDGVLLLKKGDEEC